MPVIPFMGWEPDQLELGSVQTALNIIPFNSGVIPLRSLALQTNALDARVRGAVSARDSSNNVYYYAGTETKLYELVGTTFTDESGTTYSTAADDNWEFALYKDTVVATNFADAVQSIAVGGGGAGAFADLITSTLKPKARHMATIGRFLVLGNTSDTTDGAVTYRVWWSAIDDITDFDPAATTQCDYQDLTEGGWVMGIVGGVEYGVVLQEHAIWRMTYVGSPVVFDFQPIDRDRGTQIPGSIVSHGRRIFYISEEGFQSFNGLESIPIGHNRVDRTFFDEFDIADRRRVSAAIDPLNKTVMWAFPGAGNVGGQPNRIYIYNWADDKWSEATVTLDMITSTVTQGYTLDGLDTVGTDIDNATLFPESFDSDLWRGGAIRLAGFDDSQKLGFFTGPNLAARIDFPEMQLIQGQRSILQGVRPLVNGGTPTVRIGTRDRMIDAITFTDSVTINATGFCQTRINARYHTVRMELSSSDSWSIASGIEIPSDMVRPAGRR